MDTDARKAIACEFLKQAYGMRRENLAAFMAQDATWWDLGSRHTQSRDQFIEAMALVAQMAPDGVAIDIKSVIAEGRLVVVEVEPRATLANGATYTNNTLVLCEFNNDDRIVSVKEYMDPRQVEQAFGMKFQ